MKKKLLIILTLFSLMFSVVDVNVSANELQTTTVASNENTNSQKSNRMVGAGIARPSITSLKRTTNRVVVKWTNVSGEKKYQVYMATQKNGTYKCVGTTKANVCQFTKKGLNSKTTYYFKVRAVAGNDVYSKFSPVKYVSGSTKPVTSTVYIAGSGKCFHRQGCATLKRSRSITKLTRQEAIARGKKACKVCKP